MTDLRGKGQCDRCGTWEHERHLSYDDLTRVWSAFCAIEGLACYSADEVILRDDLTPRQRSFVSTFILLWSHAV